MNVLPAIVNFDIIHRIQEANCSGPPFSILSNCERMATSSGKHNKDDKACDTGRVDIFANQRYFPPFQDLGVDNDLDLRYWYQEDPEVEDYFQSCTWCFLGEITNDERAQISFLRNRVLVRDRQGKDNIAISFYPDRGHFDFRTLKKRHTICIMLAEKESFFLSFTIGFGIRIECLDLVKVIPCGLDDLLALSKCYSQCSGSCWGCGKNAVEAGIASLKKCLACMVAQYCGRQCQARDWKERHRRWCKAMPEFIKMTRIDYSKYDENALFGPNDERIW